MKNIDKATVEGFGEEWSTYDQSSLSDGEIAQIFDEYFHVFPWGELPAGAVGFDVGCGSGRWARRVAARVGKLHCIDASSQALEVAKKNLAMLENVEFHHASVEAMQLVNGTMDFGYSLGVLHHVPDTQGALRSCAAKLKQGAPFLVYLYYRFDNRPFWFRALWRLSDIFRRAVSRLPFSLRLLVTRAIAVIVYWPLARLAKVFHGRGVDTAHWPLDYYRNKDFYVMQTDALDRFGTRLEQRFTRKEIGEMLTRAGFHKLCFSPSPPYWCVVGYKV